jgi:hypothetical protein
MQAFLFSLLNTLADANHSIDLISTQINKYHLNADFECADKPTLNGFHGHLMVEQIEIADGFGINKKLSKKQVRKKKESNSQTLLNLLIFLRHMLMHSNLFHQLNHFLLNYVMTFVGH